MVDVVRSGGRKAEEQPELDDDQHQRKNDSRQRHGKPHFVVKEIPSWQ
jgi:hypothetical protein